MHGRNRAAVLILGLAAMSATPLLYLPALNSAYRLDDYAWLSLANTMTHGRTLAWALFAPAAQGTIRPLGERIWFLLAAWRAGTNPVPLHALALVVQSANVGLVILVGRRLLGSSVAGCVAGLLWSINSVLVGPIVWASAFNEILFACLYLLAFHCFLHWSDLRKAIWLYAHIIALVLALLTLETSVTFPVVAGAWLYLSGSKDWRPVAPSAVLSALYALLHLRFSGLPNSGPYAMTFNARDIMRNLWHYWTSVLGPEEYVRTHGGQTALATLCASVLTAAIFVWILRQYRRGQMLPLFGLAWFVTILSPVLPLLGHFTYYYAFLPVAGLAWLAAGALVIPASKWHRALAAVVVCFYVACQIPATLNIRDWFLQQSANVALQESRLRREVQQIRRTQPDGPVFLQGLDMEQFWWGVCYGELLREGFSDLHITPDTAQRGVPVPPAEWCLQTDFEYPRQEMLQIIANRRGRAYNVAGEVPRPLSSSDF